MSVASDRIADTLNRAQLCWPQTVDHTVGSDERREATAWFIHHVTASVLLENIRRLDPDLADRLSAWVMGEDGIFSDGYAGELLHQWREQVAAEQPMSPIGPCCTCPAVQPHGSNPVPPTTDPDCLVHDPASSQSMDGRAEK